MNGVMEIICEKWKKDAIYLNGTEIKDANINVTLKAISRIIHKIKDKIIINNNKKGYIFWIDENIDNYEKSLYLKYFQDDPSYKQLLSSFQIIYFENLEEALDLILHYINFKVIFIIISESLYSDYYYKLKIIKKLIKCLPICVIFTSDTFKKILKERKERLNYYYISKEILDSIGNPFYNLGGVNSNFESCIKFIFNFWKTFEMSFPK